MSEMSLREQVIIAGPVNIPTLLKDGTVSQFKLYFFRFAGGDFYVLEKGDVKGVVKPLVRIQSACNIAHIFHSQRCDCQAQLEDAMLLIHKSGNGLLIYAISHEGRGVGPLDHVRVYSEQDKGLDTVDSYLALGLPVDSRRYGEIGDILRWFGIKKMVLLTNNPSKIECIQKMGFEVDRQALIPHLHKFNQSEIKVKVTKLGHLIPLTEEISEQG